MLSEEFLDIILIQNIQVVNWFLERDPSASSGGASLRVCQIKNKCVTASDFQFLIPSASPTAIWWALYLCNLKLVALSTYLFFIRALSQETSALNPLLVTSLAVYKGALYKSHHFFGILTSIWVICEVIYLNYYFGRFCESDGAEEAEEVADGYRYREHTIVLENQRA